MADLRRYPRLSPAEEERLQQDLLEGRPGAVDRLASSALSFVVKIAAQYGGQGLSLEDLLNEGNLGLTEAARRFDPRRGYRFTTYAVWWIRKSILTALSETGPVRVPYYQMKKVQRIGGAERTLRGSLGRVPTREEIAEHLKPSSARSTTGRSRSASASPCTRTTPRSRACSPTIRRRTPSSGSWTGRGRRSSPGASRACPSDSAS
jgi:RNA polymerase primary sigma factor